MNAGRRAIEHPMVLDLSALPAPPLKVLLQQTYWPAGIVQRQPDGGSVCHFPWYNELASRIVPDSDTVAVLYVLPVDDETNLLAACIGDAFDVFFRYLSGADYGDGIAALVAQHWPDVYRMLVESQGTAVRSRVLCHVRTASRLQWVVADPLRGPRRNTEISNEQATDLVITALRITLDALQFHLRLPGVIQVLGGPDRLSRRLTALSGLFGNAADLGGLFQDGLQVEELRELAKTAVEVVEGLRALED